LTTEDIKLLVRRSFSGGGKRKSPVSFYPMFLLTQKYWASGRRSRAIEMAYIFIKI